MNLEEFNFHLPQHLIAQWPTQQRDASRLMYLERPSQSIQHSRFECLMDYLKPEDLLVVNNSRTMLARLLAHKTSGAKVEILVIKQSLENNCVATALIKSNRPVKTGLKLCLQQGVTAEILGRDESWYQLCFSQPVKAIMQQQGQLPLPPYIQRDANEQDQQRYQTVYAKQLGSIATPTAGLHFTPQMLQKLQAQGIQVVELTLHVGVATFMPVRVNPIEQHSMAAETIEITKAVVTAVRQTKRRGGRVIAVGTTSVRSLESFHQVLLSEQELSSNLNGESQLFLYPGKKFQVVDALITNFHLPKSTLFMLVCAFAGTDFIKQAYQQAIDNQYRFFSYGDAMFIA